jgi:prephenate dehydratase
MKKVTFQGEDGAYSELAAKKFFNKRIKTLSMGRFEDVFKSVVKGSAAYGIVPIENSLSGSIHQNYDLLLKYHVWITGEIKLRISHNLIVNPTTKLKEIKKVFSHPQALAQCQKFLDCFRHMHQRAYYDTAGSVKFIRDNKMTDSGAIASKQAAIDCKMKILKRSIEDNEKNFTRFFVLSKKKLKPRGKCKTSVVFALKNMPGALYKSLSIFAIRDIDLYKIESRPIPGSPWKYIFYLDFKGNIYHSTIQQTMNHLGEITKYLKVLGSYPVGKEFLP